MAAIRSRSPLDLPPRALTSARAQREPAEPVEFAQVTRLPVSFGVLLLGLAALLGVELVVGALLYVQATLQLTERERAIEQRISQQLLPLRAAHAALQSRLTLAEQAAAARSRELDRLAAELEAARARLASDPHGSRSRRAESAPRR